MTKEAALPQLYHTSIYKLPLEKFLDALIDKDFSALIIEGEPAETDLQAAWEGILTDYNDAMAGLVQRRLLQLAVQLYRLQLKYNRIEALVAALRKGYLPLFAEELNERLGVKFAFDCTDWPAYLELLDGCQTRNRGTLIDIELKESELESTAKDSGTAEELTRADFLSTLITLSDHAGRELDTTMTVFTYCQRIQRYNAYCQRREREAQQTTRATPWQR